jgi:hypothetical protein
MVDPPPRRQPIDLTLSASVFRLEYYQPYIKFLLIGASTLTREGRAFRVRPIAFDPIEGDYIYTGIDQQYYILNEPDASVPFEVREIETADFYCGKDGVVIATSAGPCDF